MITTNKRKNKINPQEVLQSLIDAGIIITRGHDKSGVKVVEDSGKTYVLPPDYNIFTEEKSIMGITSYIQGKHVENVWEVQCDRDEKTGKITKKPRIRFDTHFKYTTLQNAHGEDFIVDGEIGTNSTCGWLGLVGVNKINLSEDEEVTVIQKIYRADLNAYMVHTDKVLSEKNVDKEEAEFKYNKLLAEYNKTMIEDDEELLSYCKVHQLKPEETDYDELVKIVPRKVTVAQNGLTIKADYMPNYTLNFPDISNSALTTKIAIVNSINANDCVTKLEG